MAEDISSVVSSVLSNPELMEKISGIVKAGHDRPSEETLPDVIAAISSGINKDDDSNTKSEDKTDSSETKNAEKIEEVSKFIPHLQGKSVALLKALKPFMNTKRCDMIDNFLRLGQLSELIKLTR